MTWPYLDFVVILELNTDSGEGKGMGWERGQKRRQKFKLCRSTSWTHQLHVIYPSTRFIDHI